jgi:pimeloyl-ACP methyl ester carboxylesterase
LVIERCEAGGWTRAQRIALGARRTTLRHAIDTGDASVGDLRVRSQMRSGRFGRAAYARIGVGEIVDVAVRFPIVNRNRTGVPCLGAPDGGAYTIAGSLVAPRALLDGGHAAVTLYYHGFGYSGFFFRFGDVPGYDYGLQQARAGHASVIVDRLGNPADGQLADGNATCLPAQADIADQLIAELRAGRYEQPGGATAFRRVALAGHSAGGFISEIAQYSFGSADALAVIGYTDAPSPLAVSTFFTAGRVCSTAPERAHGDSGAPNYAAFGQSDADFVAGHIHDADPAVVAVVLMKRNRDPCGDLMSATASLASNHARTGTITSPVLVISGSNDALFSPPTNQLQAATAYPGSRDVSLVELPDTGHAVTLGRTHEAFRRAMDEWLRGHGF